MPGVAGVFAGVTATSVRAAVTLVLSLRAPPPHPRSLVPYMQDLYCLASVYTSLGRVDEALPLLKACFDVAMVRCGSTDDPGVARAMAALADAQVREL